MAAESIVVLSDYQRHYALYILLHCTCVVHLILVYLLCIAQRYLSLITKPDDQLRVVKWKGLHHVETKTVDAATYIDPDKHQ